MVCRLAFGSQRDDGSCGLLEQYAYAGPCPADAISSSWLGFALHLAGGPEEERVLKNINPRSQMTQNARLRKGLPRATDWQRSR